MLGFTSDTVKVNNGCILSKIEAVAIFLMRLSTMGGNGEIGLIFKRPASTVSAVANHLAQSLFWGRIEALASFNHTWINFDNCASWGRALVAQKFFPLSNVAGFLGNNYFFGQA